MTGEITLTGQVLPIGGLKEKALAAQRADIHRLIVPRRNEADIDDVPAHLRKRMKFVLVDDADEVLDAALESPRAQAAHGRPAEIWRRRRCSRRRRAGYSVHCQADPRREMASRKKAAKAGAGAVAAGQAVRSNAYVQRLIEDEELRANLRTAFDSAKRAYGRMNGKGPTKALEDKKVQRELREAATSLREAADGLRGKKKKSGRRGRLLVVGIVGGALALALSEGLRKKVLDALFGAEEEFEYTASTTPEPSPNASATTGQPVGTT